MVLISGNECASDENKFNLVPDEVQALAQTLVYVVLNSDDKLNKLHVHGSIIQT